jgi:sugar (pentulose or hexulose) kinase
MRILAIDVGSSSVKAGLWDGSGFADIARAPFRTRFDGVQVEVPAEAVWRAVVRAARSIPARSAEAVAFCTFSCGVMVTGERGDVRAGAITHQDRRSVAEARTLVKQLGKPWLLRHTGNLPYPGSIGSTTLAWLRHHRPGIFRRGYRIGQLSSFLGRRMTGEWVIDPSQAVFLGLWDIQARTWNQRMCDAVGVKVSSLPQVVWADEVQGRLTRAAARMLELREGIPLIGGFVDGSAGMVETSMAAGQLVHNSGSTDVLAMCVNTPVPTEGVLTRPVGIGRVFPERWLAVRTIAAAGSAVDWARRVLFSELTDTAWRRVLARACSNPYRGNARCTPTFAGERASIEQRTGATFDGVTLATTRQEMLASIIRALVQESAASYAMLARIRRPQNTVYTMGGAATLQDAMHRGWPRAHIRQQLKGDSLRGLVALATRTLA